MITLSNISKKIGGRVLFDDVTLTFLAKNRYGLTGPNGAGKSTLMRIIMGLEPPTGGTVQLPKKVGFLKQNIEEFRERTAVETVVMGNTRLWKALSERDELEHAAMTDELGMRLGELEEIIAEEDGYTAEAQAEELLAGMGLPHDLHHNKMQTLPTDMQFRILLCQALFGNPLALLLDEPTNHLDLESIGWLETFLHAYEGVLVVISHDRHFLNAVATHIADIDYETLIIYPGNYDQMLDAKMAVRARTESENKTREKKISQLREFVARFGAGTRASQVQSRVREIDRLAPVELKKSNIQRPYIRFYPPEKPSGQIVLRAKNLFKAYDGKEVIRDFSCEILRGEKVGVIGNNGRGKTTLLKMLSGRLPPDRGGIEYGHEVQLGYFPQNHSDAIDRKKPMTLFDWLKGQREGIYDQDVRSILGKMLFSGDDAFKPLSGLSGGETARLILGGMMLMKHNLLILDEPNNHLDLEAVSALTWALKDFPGTVVVASHDRSLLQDACTRLIAFEEKGIKVFDGPLDEYLSSKR